MKNWLKKWFFKPQKIQIENSEQFPIVWDRSLISIYQFLLPYKNAEKLPDTANILPDEPKDNQTLRWAPGAMDGVMNHHTTVGSEQQQIDTIVTLLAKISVKADYTDVKQLYSTIKDGNTLGLIDTLIARFIKSNIKFEQLYPFIYWLAVNSPDREVVKFAIAILGRYLIKQTELFQLLGMHEEFTLYSSVALQNTFADDQLELEHQWLTLAQKVNGWGRIHLVERLAKQPSPTTKAWLLREGYKNSIMYEYLAYTCATAGELLAELMQESIDLPLLISTGEIIEALVMGGPAEDMHDYEDGAKVCQYYVEHLEKHALTDIAILRHLFILRDFIVNQLDDSYPNWNEELKTELKLHLDNLINQQHWLNVIEEAKNGGTNIAFWLVCDVYERLGNDVWLMRFERQQTHNDGQWFHLMQTDDEQRVKAVIELAKSQNDFSAIATGPACEMGFGLEFEVHGTLDFILQELERFPSLGEDLILNGLNSPVIRNRNMALKAIEGWGTEYRSNEITVALQKLAKIEPDPDVKQRVLALLS